MKICVPTENDVGLEASVSRHFGRAPYFAYVDSDTRNIEFVPNGETRHDHGRCVGAALAAEAHPEVVLAPGMGQGAFDLLRSSGARIYLTGEANLGDALDNFTAGRAGEVTDSGAMRHHHAAHKHKGGGGGGHGHPDADR